MNFKVEIPGSPTIQVWFEQYHVSRTDPEHPWVRVHYSAERTLGERLDRLRDYGCELSLATACRITRGLSADSARVVLNRHDKPNRFVARKFALEKALRQTVPHRFSKSERQAIWRAFLSASATRGADAAQKPAVDPHGSKSWAPFGFSGLTVLYPAPKFQVGQRVRCRNPKTGGTADGVIKSVGPDGLYELKAPQFRIVGAVECDLEPCAPVCTEAQLTIRVGDEVRVAHQWYADGRLDADAVAKSDATPRVVNELRGSKAYPGRVTVGLEGGDPSVVWLWNLEPVKPRA